MGRGILSGVMATITSMITTPMMYFLAEKDDKTILQEVVEEHPIGADGGGKATSKQCGSGQTTTESGGGKAAAVDDVTGGKDGTEDRCQETHVEEKWARHEDVQNNNTEHINEKITRCKNKVKIVGDAGCDTKMFSHSKNTDGKLKIFAHCKNADGKPEVT